MSDRLRTAWDGTPLRRRLVLGLLVVVTVTLVAVGIATYLTLKTWLVGQIDEGLTQVRDHVVSGQPGNGPGGDDRNLVADAVRQWTQQGATVILVNPNRTAQVVVPNYRGGSGTEQRMSPSDVAALVTVPTNPRADPTPIRLEELGESRAVALMDSADNRLVAVQPLSRVESVTGTLLLVEAIALGLALLVVGVLGAWLVRLSLRPLARVAETASQVATLQLDRGDVVIPDRVPDTNPATEVGQVGLAVNSMLDHVETSLQSRKETEDRLRRFVSDAGHELRTPLAAVRGYAELVRRAGPAHPEQALTSAVRIESAAARMGVLVDDLLLLASLDEGRPLAQDPVELVALAEDAVAEVAATDVDHTWALDESGLVSVIGDSTRLHQVVSNLLSNARAYTPSGTTVTTTVGATTTHAWIQVRDDGPGFPEDLLPHATERFTRGEGSRSRATGGSGLGLAIVRAVVETHGGHIEVANHGGAVVTVYLPTGIRSLESA